jgi:hypothetical protein
MKQYGTRPQRERIDQRVAQVRRVNRDEYANTIRDLLKLDEFFDQTQVERSLALPARRAGSDRPAQR